MLLLRPFLTICLTQVAIAAPAPLPGHVPLADHPELGHLVNGMSGYVRRLVGFAPRAEVDEYGAYGAYGKYGSYGSYPDIGGMANSETSSKVNAEVEADVLSTLTTTMPVFTTTLTLRSMTTPSPTMTAVSTKPCMTDEHWNLNLSMSRNLPSSMKHGASVHFNYHPFDWSCC